MPRVAAGSSEAYPYRNIRGHLRRIYEPSAPSACSGRDQELVMGRAVCDFIGWKLPAR
jgi:hypothetical protein